MPAITDQSKLTAALVAASPMRTFNKIGVNAEATGTWMSLLRVLGTMAVAAVPPAFGSGGPYVPTKATLGAWPFTNALVDGNLRLLKFGQTPANPQTTFLFDRLWACSGFNTTLLTAQTIVTPGVLPTGRDPNAGLDVEPWIEIYTAPGATAATWTLTGTDALGNTGRTWTYAHPANSETVGQTAMMLPGGATPAAVSGIRQPTGFACSASSAIAGDVGVTLQRRLASAAVAVAGQSVTQDAYLTAMPAVYNDAFLALVMQVAGTFTGLIQGDLVVGEAPT